MSPTRRPPAGAPDATGRMAARERLTLSVILGIAAVLLFWRLGAIYLWQDEANTAVLAVRMLKFGKPLAYDGVNLLTNDNFAAEDQKTIGDRTADPKVAVDYVIHRGDLRPDSAWTFHPWGQFVVAAASIKAFGQTTLAARLPFALAGLASVALLYLLVRSATNSPLIAALASMLLVGNAYWILHARQSRYYALSCLFLLLTVFAYDRWQRGRRWGAVAFVAAAWCWFQVDYGTVWPGLGVIFLHALIAHRRAPWTTLVAGVVLAAAIAPFLFFYQLWGRLSVQGDTWTIRFLQNAFYLDRFVIPVVMLAAAAVVLRWRWRHIATSERRLVVLSVGVLAALLLWVPSVAPTAILRYVVMAAPLGCFIGAWTLVRAFQTTPVLASVGVAVLALTPWLSLPLEGLAPVPRLRSAGAIVRPELATLMHEVFVPRRDPNGLVVEWLRQHAAPTDEILVNYEDLPLMYYLPNPIRGGVSAFRVEDDAHGPPAFSVLRRSVQFVHWPVFLRELQRSNWDDTSFRAPDVVWGNNPDPMGKIQDPDTGREFLIARRRETPK